MWPSAANKESAGAPKALKGGRPGDVLLLRLGTRALGAGLRLEERDALVVVHVELEELPLVGDAQIQVVLLGEPFHLRHERRILVALPVTARTCEPRAQPVACCLCVATRHTLAHASTLAHPEIWKNL